MKKKQKQYKTTKVSDDYMLAGLLDGMSRSQIVESYQNREQDVTPQTPPTDREIVADWILQKDQQQKQFAYGGKKYQPGGELDWTDYTKPWNPDIQDNGQQIPEIDPNISLKAADWDSRKAVAKEFLKENAVPIAQGAATGLGIIADKVGDYNNIQNKFDETKSDIARVEAYNPNFMSTTQALNQYSMMQQWQNKTKEQLGHKNGLQVGFDALSDGLKMGLATGNIWAGVGAGLTSAVADMYNNGKAIEKTNIANTLGNNMVDQNNIQFAYQNGVMNEGNLLTNLRGHFGASGGYMNSAADTFPNRLTEFNTGGNHEDNPNGGIRQGVNPQDGQPNLVEQDETKWKDYIFSKRIYADGGILEQNHLNKKYDGWSFADISKDLYKEYKERPNDPIARKTFEENMPRLQNAQESKKYKKEKKEVNDFVRNRTQDEINALMGQIQDEAMLQAEQEELAREQQDAAYEQQLNEEAAEQGLVGENGIYDTYANGGHMFQWGNKARTVRSRKKPGEEQVGDIRPIVLPQVDINSQTREIPITPITYDYNSGDTNREIQNQYESFEYPARMYNVHGNAIEPRLADYRDSDLPFGVYGDYDYSGIDFSQEHHPVTETKHIKGKSEVKIGADGRLYRYITEYGPYQNEINDNQVDLTWPGELDITNQNIAANTNTDTNPATNTNATAADTTASSNSTANANQTTNENSTNGNAKNETLVKRPNTKLTGNNDFALYTTKSGAYKDRSNTQNGSVANSKPDEDNSTNRSDYIPLLRFAPIVGSGFSYLRDLLGMQNVNDYSDADTLQRQADNLGYVYSKPIGGYQEYQPTDTEYLQNKARQDAAAARRSAANASNGNRGYVSTSDAVNGYSLNETVGEIGQKARQADLEGRLAVARFNSNIDEINSRNDLTVQEKNQAIQAQRAQLYQNIAQLRTAERYANEDARSNNESDFYKNVGNLGKEIMAARLANSNLGQYYGINWLTGDIYYKPAFYRKSKEEQEKIVKDGKKIGITATEEKED